MSRVGKWWQIEDLSFLVLSFTDPKTAFRSRGVCRTWQSAVDRAPSSFWEAVFVGVIPSCQLATQLLKKYCPRYSQLRHFSKMSLANQLTVQHVVAFDIAFSPIVWLTNVALSTQVADIALTIFHVIPAEKRTQGVSTMQLLGNGLLLDSRRTLAEHTWPGRFGKTGCRGDLCLVVKGLQLEVGRRSSVEPQEFSHLLAEACQSAMEV